jgi:hypothetical protein
MAIVRRKEAIDGVWGNSVMDLHNGYRDFGTLSCEPRMDSTATLCV